MNDCYGYKATYEKAGSRARGDRLLPLLEICDRQKSIKTPRLRQIIEKLQASDCEDAIHFRRLADEIQRLQSIVAKPEENADDEREDASRTSESQKRPDIDVR